MVEFEGEILEKPADAEDAFRVLSRLSGRINRVHTGVVIVLPNVPGEAASRQPHEHTCARAEKTPQTRTHW